MSQIKYDISYHIYGLMILLDTEILSMIGINDNKDSMYLLFGENTSMNGILPSRPITINTDFNVCCFNDNNYAVGIIYIFGIILKSFIQQPDSNDDLTLYHHNNLPTTIVKNNNNIYFVLVGDTNNSIYKYDTNTNTRSTLIDGLQNEIGVISSLFIKNDILYISNYLNEQFYISTYNFVNYNFIKGFIIIGNGSSAIEPGLITIGNDGLIYVSYFTNDCNYINVYTNGAVAVFMDTIQTNYTDEKLSGLTINKNNKLYFADKVSKSYTVLQSIYKHSHINEIAIGTNCAYVSDFVKNKIYMIYFDTTLTTFYPYEKITILSDYSGCTGIIYSYNNGGNDLFIVSSQSDIISKINVSDMSNLQEEIFVNIPNITGISSIVLSGNWFYIYTINSISAGSSASIYKINITNADVIMHVLDCDFHYQLQYNNCKIAIDNENNLYILAVNIVYKYNYNDGSYGPNVQFITVSGHGPSTNFTNMLYYDNYFYLTNSINNNISKYNIFGTLITNNYTTGGFLRDFTYDITIGGGMAFDTTGNFYTADPTKEIIKIDYVTPPNFSTYGPINNNYNDVYGIAIDNNNNLYVGNNNGNHIYKVDKLTGSNDIFFPLDGDGIDLTYGVSNIVFDNEGFPNGYLYVLTYNKIYKINSNGVVFNIISLSPPCNFGIAIDINNDIYYSGIDSNIYKLNNEINNTPILFINKDTGLINPSGIAFDSYGNVYIANNGNHYVSKYSSTGELINSKFIYVPNNGIVNIIIDKNNQYIYTAICYDANAKYGQYIYKYDISGAYISDIGFNDSTLSILGLALDLSNNLYFPNRVNGSTNITKYTISPTDVRNTGGTTTGETTTGGTTTGETTTIPTVPCFNQDTKILTIDGYKLIQNLRKGDLIKTLNDGFKPIDMIGKRDIYHPAINERINLSGAGILPVVCCCFYKL
jgi:hypothetical protein